MVNTELIFEANLNAAIPYIDKKWLADPINHSWSLKVKNQSNQTLYFKLFNAIPNWDFGTTLPGTDELVLGGIGAGSEINPIIDMVREVPVGETYDGGIFTLKAYTDPAYVIEIASADRYVTIDIQDIENWTDVEIFDFDDGTAQDWTLHDFVVWSDKSVEAGGYSLRCDHWGIAADAYISRAIVIPNRNKCNLSLFCAIAGNYSNLRVHVDTEMVFQYHATIPTSAYWTKFSVNLSPYKGQTKTIKIVVRAPEYSYQNFWWDRIVVAGKD